MSRSGLGELLLYKHSLSSDSETSLDTTTTRQACKLIKAAAPGLMCLCSIVNRGCWILLPCFDEALLHPPSHFSYCISDFISRGVGETHIQETPAKRVSVKPRSSKFPRRVNGLWHKNEYDILVVRLCCEHSFGNKLLEVKWQHI